MSSQIPVLAVLYVCVPRASVHRWLREGMSANVTPCPHKAGCVQAWPVLCPPPEPMEDAAWLVASVAADHVAIADWDLAAAASVAPADERATLQRRFEASLTPFDAYRPGQYRRPEALIANGVPPDRLALLVSDEGTDCAENERAYGRQLHRLLRAMIGAPPAAPLAALVAAAIARGRAAPIAVHRDNGRQIRTYRIDNGSGYFAFDATLAELLERNGAEDGLD